MPERSDPVDGPGWWDDAPLFQSWRRFSTSDVAPFTVPGHKRRAGALHPDLGRLLDVDVPVYGGLGTVRNAGTVLHEGERKAAALWGADWCRFSVGGSSHANQAAVLALGRPGDTVLVTRTAHRSTLVGLVMAGLRPVWLAPEVDPRFGMPVGIPLSALEAALDRHPDAVGLLCVEPAYLGASSDLAEVVRICHDRDVPVVVDQAWGAHLGLARGYPPHALQLGADAMITSAHKALPAFTQASMLLARTERLDPVRLEHAFEAGNTTSASGAVVASTDAARAVLASPVGQQLLADALPRAGRLRAALRGVGLLVPGPEDFPPGRYDPLKVVLCLGPVGRSGVELEDDLVAAGLPVEMADTDTVVLLLTFMDDDPTVDRLLAAVAASVATRPAGPPRPVAASGAWGEASPQACTPRQAFFAREEAVAAAEAVGRVSAEAVAPYPPGVPVLVPGEIVTADALARLTSAASAGLRIAYATDPSLRTLRVLADEPGPLD